MPESLLLQVEEYLAMAQDAVVSLKDMRTYLRIEPGSKDDTNLRQIMARTMVDRKMVSRVGRGEGIYKVIKQVHPITVFGRERKPPLRLFFPRDFETEMEFPFADDLIIRGGDLILISGQSNYGKTTICMNFCAENLDSGPVLMGNEYSTIDGEPSPRFLDRLDKMDWVEWMNGDGQQRFILLPVFEDYAEHIVKGKFNIVDWIDVDAIPDFKIAPVMQKMKREAGDGVVAAVIQKNPNVEHGRGGYPTKHFADLEILLDNFGHQQGDVLLTIGKVKESKRPLTGKTYAFHIHNGVKITEMREVKKCPVCHGTGLIKGWECEECIGRKYIDK